MRYAPQVRACLNSLAHETWRKIEGSTQASLSFREDSLTDHNLWTLQDAFPGVFTVHRFDQNAEKRTGADWEWWVGSRRTGWICLRIQAKRIYRRSYPQLNHAGLNDGDHQYDTLIAACSGKAWMHPMHVFFNGWEKGALGGSEYWPSTTSWSVCEDHFSPMGCSRAEVTEFGCAIASAFRVKRTHETTPLTRTVKDHLENCVPWSWLFGRPADGALRPYRSSYRWEPAHVSDDQFMGDLLSLLTFLRYDEGPLEEARGILIHDAIDLERARDLNLLRFSLPGYITGNPEDEEQTPAAATVIVVNLENG